MCVENLKKNLRYLRKKHGFGQPFIAEKLNKKSYTTIQKWESGDAEPSLKEVYILAEMYGVNIDDFVKIDIEAREQLPQPIKCEKYLSDTEKLVIKKYRDLNEAGKEYINEQFDFALTQEKYKANSSTAEPATSSPDQDEKENASA